MSATFGFEYPWVFLLLPIFGLCLYLCRPRLATLLFPGATWMREAAAKKGSFERVLRFAAFAMLVTALASPVERSSVAIQNDKGYEISLILDASGSMAQNGKFDIVKRIVEAFVKERRHDRIGLTIFADFAYVAVPLTYDKASLLRLLDKVEVGIAGTSRTALYEALFMSTKLFKDSHAKNKIAILLTDGMDNAGTVPLDVAINTAKRYGIKVYTIGVGQPGDFNPYVLERIAKETGGRYFDADSVEKLKAVYRTIDRLEKSEIKADRYIKKSYFYIWPLAAGLLLTLVILFRRRV
ncbi:vWA domain-containing protein [Hydrogenimonas sp.]